MDLKHRISALSQAIRPRLSPALVIIGAQKAGTTTLFDILSEHPRILPPRIKEIHHFSLDEEYDKGMRHYRSHFPVVPLRSTGWKTLEASPSYLRLAEKSAPRIAHHLPGVPLLAILRDPVQRAYSAWNMHRAFVRRPNDRFPEVRDTRPFAQAVEDELAGRTTDPTYQYLAMSDYATLLGHFREHLPVHHIMVRSFKDLKQDAPALVADILRTMGLEPLPAAHRAFQRRSNVRPYEAPLDPALAAELHRHFAPMLARLEDLLGQRLDLLER